MRYRACSLSVFYVAGENQNKNMRSPGSGPGPKADGLRGIREALGSTAAEKINTAIQNNDLHQLRGATY